MTHWPTLTGFALALVLAASPVGAQWGDDLPGLDFDRPGLFLGAGPLYGFENFDDGPHDFGDSAGFDLRVGWRFTSWFALEGQFQYFDEFGDTVGDPAGDIEIDLDAGVTTVNGKFYPLTGQVQPYALVGIGGTYVEVEAEQRGFTFIGDDSAFAFRGGAGIDVYLTENLLVAGEVTYILNTDTLEDFDIIPVVASVQYRF